MGATPLIVIAAKQNGDLILNELIIATATVLVIIALYIYYRKLKKKAKLMIDSRETGDGD